MGRKLTLQIDGVARELDLDRDAQGGLTVTIDGRAYFVALEPTGSGGLHRIRVDGRNTDLHIARAGRGLSVTVGPQSYEVAVRRGGGESRAAFAEGELAVTAPMSGVVAEVLVSEGTRVARGESLMVVVAMKMNNEIRSPLDGMVRSVHAEAGESVDQGALLVVLEAGDEAGGEGEGGADAG